MLIDFRSRDAPNATIDQYIERAEVRGINEIAFTTHLIVNGPDTSTGIRKHEIEDYIDDIWSAQEDTDIKLRTGFEVDYFYEKEAVIDKLVNQYDLDFVLGSVHVIKGKNIGVSKNSYEFFRGKRLQKLLRNTIHNGGMPLRVRYSM